MSTPVVATVAWLALGVSLVLGAVVLLLLRRVASITRAHTDRKWEVATLRAEVAALRRSGLPADVPGPGAPDAEPERGGRSRPASPTAWRRDRARTPSPPRRRPGRSGRRSD